MITQNQNTLSPYDSVYLPISDISNTSITLVSNVGFCNVLVSVVCV